MRRATAAAALALFAICATAAPRRSLAGHYEWKKRNAEASIDVESMPGGKVKVTGEALWNTQNIRYGPNLGDFDFVAEVRDGVVTHDDGDYHIEIRFTKSGLTVTERNTEGYFGHGVTFAGNYVRSRKR